MSQKSAIYFGGDGKTNIDTLDPGSGQIAVEEGRDGLAGLCDLAVVAV